jgi:hypothetical protein
VYPRLQIQFPAVQFPCEEQTRGFVELIPKQILNSHSFPIYPTEQEQLSFSMQIPFDEQTGSFNQRELFFPKQIGVSQFFPLYPSIHEQTFGNVQFPLFEQTEESLNVFPKHSNISH